MTFRAKMFYLATLIAYSTCVSQAISGSKYTLESLDREHKEFQKKQEMKKYLADLDREVREELKPYFEKRDADKIRFQVGLLTTFLGIATTLILFDLVPRLIERFKKIREKKPKPLGLRAFPQRLSSLCTARQSHGHSPGDGPGRGPGFPQSVH